MTENQAQPMAGQFRKKPVVIDAWMINFDNAKPDWVAAAFTSDTIDWCPAGEGLYINTLEGHMKGDIGDWLIRGVKGELYACKPDIFAATYEPATLPAPAPQAAAEFNTSEAGRSEVARFFAEHLKRHDFTTYIKHRLAADFACAIAPTLHAIMAAPTGAAPAAQGLPVSQEPKYTVNGYSIVNRASGEAIPADEPVFIFRARDVHAMYALRDYLSRLPLGTPHRKAVEQRVMDFFDFKAAHTGRMKEPDTDQPTAAPAVAQGEGAAYLSERGRIHVAGLRSIRARHALSQEEHGALTVAIAVMKRPPAIPCNEELERLAENHQGHPADFAADVLERWGGWQPGLLGYGGSVNAANFTTPAPSAPAPAVAADDSRICALLDAFRTGQVMAEIPDEDQMPTDPVKAVEYLIRNIKEWR